MPINLSSSSAEAVSWALLTGTTSAGHVVAASFQLGDNSGNLTGTPESMLECFDGNGLKVLRLGHLTWDPLFGEPAKPFTASAQVNFDLASGSARWAVGTGEFLNCDCPTYQRITMIEIEASARDRRADALLRWDLIEVTLHHVDGGRTVELSSCLPRVSTLTGVRRSTAASAVSDPSLVTQHAQLSIRSVDVVRILIRGQVSLRLAAGTPYEPDELTGRILVHVD